MTLAKFECGAFLDRCQCVSAVALNPAAMQQRHEAAVARAKRSDAGLAPSRVESASMRGRRISTSQRTQQRATSDASMLLDILRRAS